MVLSPAQRGQREAGSTGLALRAGRSGRTMAGGQTTMLGQPRRVNEQAQGEEIGESAVFSKLLIA